MEVGSYDAKTHLPRLLEQVAKGQRITITKHGVPVAMLVPVGFGSRRPRDEVVADLRRFRKGRTVGNTTLKEMIEHGRR